MGIKENKPDNNRKPFMFYYAIVMLVMMLVNLFLMPFMQRRAVTEVPYSAFREMIEEGVVTQVGRNDQQITFTQWGRTWYSSLRPETGRMMS